MNDRARAISVLQQARDILAERLTERILESRDSILEDALGLSYSSEIDAVQEQIGMRLNNVHMLLNNLPPMEEASSGTDEDEEPTMSSPIAIGYEPETQPSAVIELSGNTFYADSTFHDVKETAVVVASPQPAIQPTVISFQAFAERVLANDVEGAGTVLAGLFDVSGSRGRECAKRFQEQLAERPQFLQKAMGLRLELSSGSVNGALLVLWECFGLQGLESIAALQALKTRFGLGTN